MRFRKMIIPAAGLVRNFCERQNSSRMGSFQLSINQRQYIAEEKDMIIVTGRGKRAT